MEDEAGTDNTSNRIVFRKVRGRNIGLAIAVILIIVMAGLSISLSQNEPEQKGTPSAAVGVMDLNMTTIVIPIASISQNATWYEYDISGSNVRFFAVMDTNGVIHTAFDECWMCFNNHLGFRQEGASTDMIENCCNMSFPIVQITEAGCSEMGCCPIFLESMVEGDHLAIAKSELAKQRFVFLTTDETEKVRSINATLVGIPLSSVSVNASWYRYDISGSTVRFFAVRDANGTIHTAFDECWMCYPSHQGFRQDGSQMVENCCNRPISIENITENGCSGTGCYPVHIASQIVGDELAIAISDLRVGAYMFT